MILTQAEIERFWGLVDEGAANECWQWKGPTKTVNKRYTPMTYGAWSVARNGKSINRNAHRFAWIIANKQSPPAGWVICHKCDNPLCCNPAHLFAGTRADNQRDMQAKLRSGVLGTKNPKAVLTEAQVIEIRQSEESDKVLAERYGVKPWAIGDARTGRHWKHLPGARPDFYRGNRKLTPDQVRELRARHRAGVDCVTLGRTFGLSQAAAWQAAKGNTYRNVGE